MGLHNASTTRLGYFPGCTLFSTGRDYGESLAAVSAAAGIELVEIPDWNCCGATSAHAVNKQLGLALPLRNLALAEQEGLKTVLAPCAACYNRLHGVNHALSNDPDRLAEIEEIISRKYDCGVRCINALEYAADYLLPALESRLSPIGAIRFASYYGCLLVRLPSAAAFDDREDPSSMDEIVESLGACAVDWPHKVECCGAGHSLSRTDIVRQLSGAVLEAACRAGADAIVTACPMCHSNLDMRQGGIRRAGRTGEPVPVYYITEIIGLAAGIDEADLGLGRHFVRATGLAERMREGASG